MKLERSAFALWIILICLFLSSSLRSQVSPHPAGPNIVPRYIQAVQKQDFKTIVDLTYSYQQQVEGIKAQYPQALWPKMVGEYYQDKITALTQNPGYWGNYAGNILSSSGDPTQGIRAITGLLPLSCKWAITETRPTPGGATAYVTVSYPEISEAPVVGSQLLKQTILQFSLNTAKGLVAGMQKVSQGDVYWTGGPDVHIALAKRFSGVGLWDAAISQLKPLESDNKLSSEAKAILASAYYQRVASQCFAPFSTPRGKRFSQFKEDNECMADAQGALTLQPNLKKAWVNQLVSYGDVSLQADVPDTASSYLKIASRFAAGDPDLEVVTASFRERVGRYYLAMADYHLKGWGFSEALPDLKNAIGIWPDESIKRSMEVAKAELGKCSDPSNAFCAFGVLDSMKAFGLQIPQPELPQFLQYAHSVPQNLRTEWEKRVRELAAPVATSSAPTPPFVVSFNAPAGDSIGIVSISPQAGRSLPTATPVEFLAKVHYKLVSADAAILALYIERFAGAPQRCSEPSLHHTEGGERSPITRGEGDVELRFTWKQFEGNPAVPLGAGGASLGVNFWTTQDGRPVQPILMKSPMLLCYTVAP